MPCDLKTMNESYVQVRYKLYLTVCLVSILHGGRFSRLPEKEMFWIPGDGSISSFEYSTETRKASGEGEATRKGSGEEQDFREPE